MTRMTLADFEYRYRADPDPWGYTTSAYEHEKYVATLEACGAFLTERLGSTAR